MAYTLKGLAKAAGVTKFVIRNYVRGGLLPPAVRDGSHSYFHDEHLHRLLAIRVLRSERLRGGDLFNRMRDMSREELHALAGVEAPAPREPPAPPVRATTRDLVDAALCIAAEAADVSPRVLRPAFAAALARLAATGMSLEVAARELAGV